MPGHTLSYPATPFAHLATPLPFCRALSWSPPPFL